MNLLVRPSQPSDDSRIRALLEESHLPTESVGTGVTEFFLATEGHEIVGVAGFEFYNDDALLRSVAIAARLRDRGMGSLLVAWMIGHAKERNMKRIFLLTQTAENFFARTGFHVTGRTGTGNPAMESSEQFSSSCPSSAVCMKMELC